MSVHDNGVLVRYPELLQYLVRHLAGIGQLEVRVGDLLVRLLVVEEIALEGRHLILSEQR